MKEGKYYGIIPYLGSEAGIPFPPLCFSKATSTIAFQGEMKILVMHAVNSKAQSVFFCDRSRTVTASCVYDGMRLAHSQTAKKGQEKVRKLE